MLGAHLVSVAADYFNVPPDTLLGRNKHGAVTAARRAITYILIKDIGWSSSRVAKLFNQKHPSILDGYRKAQSLVRSDPVFYDAVERLKNEIFYHDRPPI